MICYLCRLLQLGWGKSSNQRCSTSGLNKSIQVLISRKLQLLDQTSAGMLSSAVSTGLGGGGGSSAELTILNRLMMGGRSASENTWR